MPRSDSSLRENGGKAPPGLRIVGGRDSTVDLDRRLRVLLGRRSRCRLVEGWLAADLVAWRAWFALGFVRLSDYSRERLDLGARLLEEEARVSRALRDLPRLTRALLDDTLPWTAVRLLAGVASRLDEEAWIDKARELGTRGLAEAVRKAPGRKPSPPVVEDEDAGEDPARRWSIHVSREGRRLWRTACEVAERSAGGAAAVDCAPPPLDLNLRDHLLSVATLEELQIRAQQPAGVADADDAADPAAKVEIRCSPATAGSARCPPAARAADLLWPAWPATATWIVDEAAQRLPFPRPVRVLPSRDAAQGLPSF